METRLEENREALAKADEELMQLEGVYNALQEGLKEVQNYLDGN